MLQDHCFYVHVYLNDGISDLLGAFWRLEDFEILHIRQGGEECDSPLGNLGDERSFFEEDI